MPEAALPPALPPIHTIRGRRVVLDSDLASLYGVPTMVFNQTIKRNTTRFPGDFIFQLTREEVVNLKSQMVISSSAEPPPLWSQNVTLKSHGGRRKLPWAFTEHGAIMAATILRSPRAVAMSVYVVRAFVRMREEFVATTALMVRLKQIDRTLLIHDAALRDVYAKIRPLLLAPPAPPKRKIGFHEGNR